MNSSVTAFIESGILELYVIGAATPQEAETVEEMAAAHPEVREELETISQAMESYAQAHAVKPKSSVKPLIMASLDYMERMQQGELPASPPVLTEESTAADFAEWLNRPDMYLPDDAADIYAKIIGYTPAATTAIAWLKTQSDVEVHHDEYEKFLILQGTCQMFIGEEVYELKAGDFFDIPLHKPHQLRVTSEGPCKAILQRISVS